MTDCMVHGRCSILFSKTELSLRHVSGSDLVIFVISDGVFSWIETFCRMRSFGNIMHVEVGDIAEFICRLRLHGPDLYIDIAQGMGGKPCV
jgi:hypothetical protein